MKLHHDVDCVSLISTIVVLVHMISRSYLHNDLPTYLWNRVSLLFLGVQGKKKLFFGSNSMLEIIFWAVGSLPQPEHPCQKYIRVPPWGKQVEIK